MYFFWINNTHKKWLGGKTLDLLEGSGSSPHFTLANLKTIVKGAKV